MKVFQFCPFCGRKSLVARGFSMHWGTSTRPDTATLQCAACGTTFVVEDTVMVVNVQVRA